jgi:predicted Zn-dependent protease
VQLVEDSETLRYLGQALLEQGAAADAIVPLRRAVTLDPSSTAARFWLAQAYRGAGQGAQADAEMAALRKADPAGATRSGAR